MPDQQTTITLHFGNNLLLATWPDSGDDAYDFRLLDAQGQLVPQSAQTVATNHAQVSGDVLVNGERYAAQMRPHVSPEMDGGWCDPTSITILKVISPQNLVLNFLANSLVANWDAVVGTDYYLFTLLDANQQAVQGFDHFRVTDTSISVDGNLITDNSSYTAQVVAVASSPAAQITETIQKFDPVLQQLEARLQPAASDPQTVVFNAQTIDDAGIMHLLSNLIGNGADAQLTIENATFSHGASNDTLVISGQTTLPNNVQVTALNAVFSSQGSTLLLRLEQSLSAGWTFSQSFPELAGSFLDRLSIADSVFVLTSQPYDFSYVSNALPMQSGLNLATNLSVTGPLAPAATILGSMADPVPLFGPVVALNDAAQNHNLFLATTPLSITAPDLSILGMAALALSNLRLAVESVIDPGSGLRMSRGIIYATTPIGNSGQSGVQIGIVLPIAPFGWRVFLVPQEATPLTLNTILVGIGGTTLPALLPTSLYDLVDDIAITQFCIDFSPATDVASFISFTIFYPAGWSLIPGLLLQDLRLSLQVAHYPPPRSGGGVGDTFTSGTVSGNLRIQDTSTDDNPDNDILIAMSLAIPPSAGMDWRLSVTQEDPRLPNLTQLGQLLGNATIADAALPPDIDVDNPASFVLNDLEVNFNPFADNAAQILTSVYFNTTYTPNWEVASGITLESIWLNFTAINPFDNDNRDYWWSIAGSSVVAGVQIDGHIDSPSPDFPYWELVLDADGSYIPALDQFLTFSGGPAALESVPADLVANEVFAIGGLLIDIAPAARAILQVQLKLRSYLDWQIIPQVFSLNSVDLDLQIQTPPEADVAVTGQITAKLSVLTAGFDLIAQRNDPNSTEGWLLSGTQDRYCVLNITDLTNYLLNKLLPGNFVLPQGFPTVLLSDARVSFATGSKAFAIGGASTAIWTFPDFGANALLISALTVDYATDGSKNDGSGGYALNVAGGFNFSGITALAQFSTSSVGQDTIFVAEVSNDQAAALSLPGMAAALLNGQSTVDPNNPPTWSALLPTVPGDLAAFGLVSAKLAINFSKDVYMLYGQSSVFGQAALLFAKDQQNDDWGYMVAVSLSESFTFASIWAPLSAMDGILKVRNASFSLVSFSAASARNVVNAFPDNSAALLPSPRQELSSIIQFSATGDSTTVDLAAMRNGFNFYAALDFPAMHGDTGSQIFPNILQVLPNAQNKADLTLYGVIDNAVPANTVFVASFGTYLLFETLEFSGVKLSYSPYDHNTLDLVGRMTLTFTQSESTEQNYAFDGRLIVNDATADFTITQAPETPIVAPLYMFGITLSQLQLAVHYAFQTQAQPLVVAPVISLKGRVAFGLSDPAVATSLLVLDGVIAFVGYTPVLVSIALAQPLPILNFFSTVITGTAWPDNFVDISLLAGSIYYYDKTADAGNVYAQMTDINGTNANAPQVQRKNAFNIESEIDLFGVVATFKAHIVTDATADESTGITVSGQFTDPLDFGFLAFTGPDYSGSPALTIEVTDQDFFGLDAGFKLFNDPFAKARVGIVKQDDDDAKIEAQIVYDGDIDFFKGTRIAFSYSQSEGFQIEDWPLSFLQDLDYADLLKGMKGGQCAPLGTLLFDKVVKTRFYVNATANADVDAQQIAINLNGYYAISLVGADAPFVCVGLPTMTVTVQLADSLAEFAESIPRQILDNAVAIVGQLFAQPVKLAAFFATVGVSKVSQEVLDNILCNETEGEGGEAPAEDPEAAEQIEALEEEAAALQEEAEALAQQAEAADSFAEAMELAAQAATLATEAGELALSGGEIAASASAGAAAAAALATLAAVTAAIAATATAILYMALSRDDNPDAAPSEDPEQETRTLAAPTVQRLYYANGRVACVWTVVDGAEVYNVVLKNADGSIAGQFNRSTGYSTGSFDASGLAPDVYHVVVTASGRGYKNNLSDSAAFSTPLSVTKLPVIAKPGLHYDDSLGLLASWNALSIPANYTARLYCGVDYLNALDRTSQDGSAGWDVATVSATLDAGSYTVIVQAQADDTHIAADWSAASDAVVKLPAPFVDNIGYADNQVKVDMRGVDGASAYDARLLLGATQIAPVNVSATQARFDAAALAAGRYNVITQSLAGNDLAIASAWSAPSDKSISKLAAPAIVSAGIDLVAEQVIVTLTAVNGADNYSVRLLKNDLPVGDAVPVDLATMSAAIPISPGWETGDYGVEAQATSLNNTAVPSNWQRFDNPLTRLAQPNITALVFDASSGLVMVSFDPVASSLPGNVRYLVQLLAGATRQAFGTPLTVSAGAAALSAALDAAGMSEGQAQVQVRAVSDNQQVVPSAWAVSTQVLLKLAAPSVATVAIDDSQQQALVSLTGAVDGANHYQAQYLDDAGNAIGPFVQADGLVLTLPTGDLQPGVATIQVRATADANTYIWSDWHTDVATTALTVLGGVLVTEFDYDAGGNQFTVNWNRLAGAQSYQVQLLADDQPFAAPATIVVGDPALSVLEAHIALADTLPAGSIQAQVRASSNDPHTIAGAWGLSAQTLTRLEAPTGLTLALQQSTLLATWQMLPVASPEALRYDFRLLNADQTPALAQIDGIEGISQQIDVSHLPEGSFYGQVCGVMADLPGLWSAQSTLQIAALTPQLLAQQLHAQGESAQQAAPVIMQAFGSTTAAQMIELLTGNFPESTKTLVQVAWALSLAGFAQSVTAQALGSAYPNASTLDIGLALKAAYPAQASLDQANALNENGFTAQTAAFYLYDGAPWMNSVQLGILLTMQLAASVVTPLEMAQALRNAGFAMNDASTAIGQIYPLSSTLDIGLALRDVYQPGDATAFAQFLRSEGLDAVQSSAQIRQSFTATSSTQMIALLKANFAESIPTLTQVAWALQQASYDQNDASAAIVAAYPGTSIADLGLALKSGYPSPAVLADAGARRNSGATAQTAASSLRNDNLGTSIQLAIVLCQTFASTVADPWSMAQALSNANFDVNDTAPALKIVYPLIPSQQLAIALQQVYPT